MAGSWAGVEFFPHVRVALGGRWLAFPVASESWVFPTAASAVGEVEGLGLGGLLGDTGFLSDGACLAYWSFCWAIFLAEAVTE